MARRSRALAAGLVLIATACGSTAQVSNGSVGSSGTNVGALAAPSTNVSTPGGASTTPGVSSVVSPGGPTAGGGSPSSSSNGVVPGTAVAPETAATSSGSNAGNGPGVTGSTINVGIFYETNTAAYEAALGNTTVTSPDPHAVAQIVINYINSTGGIAGRKVVPVYDSVSATSTATTDEIAQSACAAFTQDHKVFAAMPALPFTTPFNACITHAGGVLGAETLTGESEADFAQFPNLFDILSLSTDRLARDLVPSLIRQNYFTPWNTDLGRPGTAPVKVAIMAPDQVEYTSAVDNILIPELKSHGISASTADTLFYAVPQSVSDDGATVAQIDSATLKFRSDQVTHVITLDVNSQVFFGNAAELQHYRPRYGVDSGSGAQAYAGSLLPYAQLNGAVGLGYSPMEDLPSNLNPDDGPFSNTDRRQCVQIMKSGGITFGSTNAEAVALAACDLLESLRSIIDKIPSSDPINQADFDAALNSVGTLPSGNNGQIFFGPNHHDGAAVGWDYEFQADCKCMRYTSSAYPLS